MCTMSWFVSANGYELFFNRDESLKRGQAKPPTHQYRDDIAYLSPTDTDAGGTWIAVNQYGVTVCLLNHYQYEQIETYKDWVSRGEIVKQFSIISGPRSAADQFAQLSLDNFRAFRMFVIDRTGQNCLLVWDGHQPRIENNVIPPKSSSSVDAKHVKTQRRALFEDMGLTDQKDRSEPDKMREKHLKFHTSHSPDPSKESVCMHRSDAKTVSLCHVRVAEPLIQLRYSDGSPCEVELALPLSLEMVSSPNTEESSNHCPTLTGSSGIEITRQPKILV